MTCPPRRLHPALAAITSAALAIGTAAGQSGLLISEIAPAGTTLADEEGEFEDWIELYNHTAEPVQLAGYSLSDDPAEPLPWVLPEGLTVGPYGFVVLWADDDEEDGPRHLDFGLKRSGEAVVLRDPTGAIADSVAYPAVPFRASYARGPAGGFFLCGAPSPGAPNPTASAYLPPPTATVPSGSYPGPIAVELSSAQAGASIYYTLDGSPPTTASTPYARPVAVDSSASLRAMAAAPGFADSRDDTWAYLIADPIAAGFDALMLTADPVDFFSDTAGIYVVGTNGREEYCALPGQPANYFWDWEVPANFQLLLGGSGGVAFDVDGETQINGVCSRLNAQKSLALSLKEKTHGDDVVDYALFPTRGRQAYDRLKIRNGGQDWNRILMRDYVNQTLLAGQLDLEVQLGRPVVLYVNGDFFGIHNLREKYRPSYFAENFDVDDDALIVLKSPGAPYGEVKVAPDTVGFRSGTFDALQRFVEGADLNDPADYARFAAEVDVDNLLTYFSVMTYLGNRDWPGNNLTAWRELGNPDRRWRFAVADTDMSSGSTLNTKTLADYNTLAEVLDPDCPVEPHCLSAATLFLRRALERDDLRAEFIQRTNTLAARSYAPQRAVALIDSVEALYGAYRERTFYRWAGQPFGAWIDAFPIYVEDFRTFYAERPGFFRDFMREAFGLDGATYELTVGATAGGGVVLHGDRRPVDGGFTATYFAEVPLRIAAVPAEGYAFDSWLETGETSPELLLTSDGDLTRTPLFRLATTAGDTSSAVVDYREAGFGVSPNPTSGTITVSSRVRAGGAASAFRVYDAVGREVLRREVGQPAPVLTLDVSELAPGYYLLRRDGAPGSVPFVRR